MAESRSKLLALKDESYIVEVVPDAWERQSYEPHFWYQVFRRFYLDAGLTRTLKKAFRMYIKDKYERDLTDEERKRVPKQWYEVYHYWDWENRAILFDEDETYKRNLGWAERQNELREKEWRVATKLLSLAEDTLAQWMTTFEESRENTGKVPQLRFVDIERAVNLASKVGRLSAGLATEMSNVSLDFAPKKRDIEAVRKKRWNDLEAVLGDLDEDPTVIEGEIVEDGK